MSASEEGGCPAFALGYKTLEESLQALVCREQRRRFSPSQSQIQAVLDRLLDGLAQGGSDTLNRLTPLPIDRTAVGIAPPLQLPRCEQGSSTTVNPDKLPTPCSPFAAPKPWICSGTKERESLMQHPHRQQQWQQLPKLAPSPAAVDRHPQALSSLQN